MIEFRNKITDKPERAISYEQLLEIMEFKSLVKPLIKKGIKK
jgi:hypothetical protein